MSDERFKFSPRVNELEFARDAAKAIHTLLDAGKMERKKFLKLKYEVAREMLDKYPGMETSAQAPLNQMMHQSKVETNQILDTQTP